MTEEGRPIRRWTRRLATGALAALLAASPWWGRATLRRLDFFRVRRVEVDGTRYVSPDEIVQRLRIDTTASLWDDLGELERRVRQHPSVRSVRVERRLPGTLLVRVTEDLPVALVQVAGRLVPVDAEAKTLPINPAIADVDLPVLATRDSLALHLLGEMREKAPALFARVGEVQRVQSAGNAYLVLRLTEQPVRDILVSSDVTAERLNDIVPVEQDLARRNVRAAELDLRFRDQVVARLQKATREP